ncbi:hypothetical protein K458DRAFT_416235 [Lentithecium fluviatile CBS 122367]|uniref:Uncharacterized protein n=1 Tax=Lentithecium fluviatile CBS 122367 TaxID=1168545 RepID=A0A6G1J9K7_9PLEO|nr:hypothetical protein K458DRAFT_416235 [Lentithecium fluviatile CBS 122367]
MTSLLNLPDELLLQVAGCLAIPNLDEADGGYRISPTWNMCRIFEDGHNPDTDLRHLCLASRRLRPIACAVLYRYPKIPTADQPAVGERTAPIVYLLRTLASRPDLARSVQKIDLLVRPRCSGHSLEEQTAIESNGDCVCTCGYRDLAVVIEQLVERQEMRLWTSKKLQNLPSGSRRQRYQFYSEWVHCIRCGEELALVDMLLHLLPNLQHMSTRSSNFFEDELLWGQSYHNTSRLGVYPAYSPIFVPGFANLRSITSDHVLPWSVVTMPTLKTLEYHVEFSSFSTQYVLYASTYVPRSACSNISALILNLDVRFLEFYVDFEEPYEYIERLLEQTSAINILHVRMTYSEDFLEFRSRDDDPDPYDERIIENTKQNFISLHKLLKGGNLSTVRDFVVDRSDTRILNGQWHEPFLDFSMFPSLERLVTPQCGLFDFSHTRLASLRLASTLKTLEIIDSTRQLNAVVKGILEDRDAFPDFGRIVFWCDKKDKLLVLDEFLREVPACYDPACGRDPAEVEGEMNPEDRDEQSWKPFDWVDNDIWDKVRDAGIEVIIGQEKRGWRQLCR